MDTPVSQVLDEPLQDGCLKVKVSGGEADGKELHLDLLLTKVAIEQVENKYKVGSNFKASPEFLQDLTKAIQDVGFPQCTPTLAYQLWHKVSEAWALLKKSSASTPSLLTTMEPQLVHSDQNND